MKSQIYYFKIIPMLATHGGCPRIGIFSQIEVFGKNKHSDIGDITSIIFLK